MKSEQREASFGPLCECAQVPNKISAGTTVMIPAIGLEGKKHNSLMYCVHKYAAVWISVCFCLGYILAVKKNSIWDNKDYLNLFNSVRTR